MNAAPMPSRIAALPRDRRGLPIPPTVARHPDGTPDFRVTDDAAWRKAIARRTCGVCGKQLRVLVAFIGGPKSIASRTFYDLPMHRACAIYALRVCPFLAAPKMTYAKREPTIGGMAVRTDPNMSPDRPEVFGLGITRKFGFDGRYLHAGEWVQVEWWRHGQQVAPFNPVL